MPHCYGRTTRRLAIRKPNKKGGCRYVVLVITDMQADLLTLLGRYDARSRVPESMFCQDNQGLAKRKLRKQKFEAQQMLCLLSQLAHNLIRWVQRWILDVLETNRQIEAHARQMLSQPLPDQSPALPDIIAQTKNPSSNAVLSDGSDRCLP
ncbi:MAG: hypothetical protein OXN17_07045 [Candidatus Poribacteria bacterium]|nr:hypothetical protein [Candidatus Poribacteria bacterium]